ncbi:MAG: hypothetical protein KGJ13_09485 [Patescibacteria group bacterium]|nr:hypothetical protein [Patescibacteria group bacterium]
MIIPGDPQKREEFYNDIMLKCLVSREDRKGDYDSWRSWFLFGNGPEDGPAQFNKIYSHIDQLTSFMYSAETTRFSILLGAAVDPSENARILPLMQALNDRWHDTDADLVFNTALSWSMPYASTFIKTVVVKQGNTVEFKPYMVAPQYVGVLREDTPGLDNQEAFVHIYYITKSELYRRIFGHPRRDDIIKRINIEQHKMSDMPEAVDRIVLSATSPNMQGTVNLDLNGQNKMQPNVSEETCEIRELYVWDDTNDDYQVVTIADPDVVIFDRPNEKLFLKGESPLTQVCPTPMPEYFWGMSEVQKLIPLQQLRNNRMNEILELLKKQVNPPKVLTGFSGIFDEKNFALNREGGLLATDMPNAKAEQLTPNLPENLWREIDQIDSMFAEASGISPILAGHGEEGVRSAGHASQLARLGASRAKKRALIVEDNLEKLATLYLKLMRTYDDTHYTDEENKRFIAKQFTPDFTVKVDAHSNSPIFMEDLRQLAFTLYKGQVIDKEMLVRLLQPPMESMILDKIRKLPKQQQEAPMPKPEHKKGGNLKAVGGE